MNNLKKNVAVNTISKFWALLSSIIFVPIYIKLLGEEAYGIVTFFTTLQTVLSLMGVGLQKTLRREFSKNESDEKINENKYKLLKSCEVVYIVVSLIIVLICLAGSKFIANKWLKYDSLSLDEVSFSISLMGFAIAFQLFSNLYIGGIFGLDLQVSANFLTIGWSTLKNVGVIAFLICFKNSLSCFYVWFVFCDLLYCFISRFYLIKKVKKGYKYKWNFSDMAIIKHIWKYAVGLLVISIGSTINTQIDKIIISKYLPVIYCGAYNSTFHIANLITNIPTIFGTAIFSQLAAYDFSGEKEKSYKIFKDFNRLSVIIISALSAFMAVFSYEIVYIWSGSDVYSSIIKYAGFFIVFGVCLNSFQILPYEYLLSMGKTRLNEMQILLCIPFVLCITLPVTIKFGLIGASICWFFEMLLSTIFYLTIFYKKYFNMPGFKCLLKDYFSILLFCLIPAIVLKTILHYMDFSILLRLVLAILFGLITLVFVLLFFYREKIKGLILRLKEN